MHIIEYRIFRPNRWLICSTDPNIKKSAEARTKIGTEVQKDVQAEERIEVEKEVEVTEAEAVEVVIVVEKEVEKEVEEDPPPKVIQGSK